jgi:fumarylacetoacetate (FAA) hydrolase family protein
MRPIDFSGTLPKDSASATLVGRVWRPDVDGPSVVAIRGHDVVDVTASFPTVRDLCEQADPASALAKATGERIGTVEAILGNGDEASRDPRVPWFLAPIDLQAVKAAGVTFVASMLERVIEERTRGAPELAAAARKEVLDLIGGDLQRLKPGSAEAAKLKDWLIAKNAWSQYLEVGIGPDAEIFTKSQPMSSVGTGATAGIHPVSRWNNPEPEVVLVIASSGRIVGAALGNDVNLRDVEGRSALLLGKAKDNNASCAIGPFVRLFDGSFTLDDVRRMDVELVVAGEDNFRMEGMSSLKLISRDPADIAGLVLFLGTMFAPVQDRDGPGQGFTHKIGDIVTISASKLGALTNRIATSDKAPPWTFGVSHLYRNLAKRGLLKQ